MGAFLGHAMEVQGFLDVEGGGMLPPGKRGAGFAVSMRFQAGLKEPGFGQCKEIEHGGFKFIHGDIVSWRGVFRKSRRGVKGGQGWSRGYKSIKNKNRCFF